HGGKWNIAPWIIANMPGHTCYVEPFGGGANVLLRKRRTASECYNDLDGQVVNVFRVLQDPRKAEELCRRVYFTPFARAEFDRTYDEPFDDIEWARFTIARSFMGYGSDSVTRSCRTGFRSKWATWPGNITDFVERLRGVVIENRDAYEVIARFDCPETLFYIDPP